MTAIKYDPTVGNSPVAVFVGGVLAPELTDHVVFYQLFASSGGGIGTPESLGYGGTASGGPISYNTTAAIQTSDLVVFAVTGYENAGNTFNVSGVSDGTNTYSHAGSTNLYQFSAGNYAVLDFWYTCSATAVPSGTTVTATTANGDFAYSGLISGVRVTGMKSTSCLDVTPSPYTSSSTTTPSASTGTLAQAHEVVFGATHVDATNSITESSGFTTINQPADAYRKNMFCYEVTSSTGSVTYAPTLGSSGYISSGVVSFKGATP
jgi:hypothetical protein